MNFITPKTWSYSELVTEAMLNQELRDQLLAIWVGTAAGDMDFYSASNAKSRLPKPSVISLLTNSASGVPTWLNRGAAFSTLRTNADASALEFAPLMSYATVKRTATMSITSETSILWNSEIYDPNGWHNNSTNSNQIKPAVAGTYIASCYVHANPADLLRVDIKLNNAELIGSQRSGLSGGFDTFVQVTSRAIEMTATDYVNVSADNNSGTATMQTDSWFQLMRVR